LGKRAILPTSGHPCPGIAPRSSDLRADATRRTSITALAA